MKPKNKKCISCGRDDLPHFSKNRCKRCVLQDSKPLKKTKFNTNEKTVIKKITQKTANKKQAKKERLDVFFKHHIEKCKFSEESGQSIYLPTTANVCHLFPKRNHKSVEDNLDNYVYLTLQEHSDFDKYLDQFDFIALENNFPNSWEKVCVRMKNLLPLVKENTKFKLTVEKYLNENNF